jgi:hypothetical protein
MANSIAVPYNTSVCICRKAKSDDQRAALEAARERFTRYKALHLNRKIERTRVYSQRNVEQARTLRDRYNQPEH